MDRRRRPSRARRDSAARTPRALDPNRRRLRRDDATTPSDQLPSPARRRQRGTASPATRRRRQSPSRRQRRRQHRHRRRRSTRTAPYSGWGTSRHGDIQATVVIEGGRIASAVITQCLTRYSCSWVATCRAGRHAPEPRSRLRLGRHAEHQRLLLRGRRGARQGEVTAAISRTVPLMGTLVSIEVVGRDPAIRDAERARQSSARSSGSAKSKSAAAGSIRRANCDCSPTRTASRSSRATCSSRPSSSRSRSRKIRTARSIRRSAAHGSARIRSRLSHRPRQRPPDMH